MSVQEHIDTTISLNWPGRRTIGTLTQLKGHDGRVNALSGPDEQMFMTVTVEGETADDAIAIDGLCIKSEETPWGEREIQFRVLRLGTLSSVGRLRAFIEEHEITPGGAVRVGRSKSAPNQQRVVYSLPEPSEPIFAAEVTLPDAPSLDILQAAEIQAPALAELASLAEMSLASTEEATPAPATINTLSADGAAEELLGDSAFDDALRDALQAIEPTTQVNVMEEEEASEPTVQVSVAEMVAAETVDAAALNTPTVDMEATSFLTRPLTLDNLTPLGPGQEVPSDVTQDEFNAYQERITQAVEVERSSADDDFDLNEPIVVNTVDVRTTEPSPVQIGHDNRPPALADAPAAASPDEMISLEMPEPETSKRPTTRTHRTSTQRIEQVAPDLASALTAPAPLGAESPQERRRASGSMKKLQQLFHADFAIRCQLDVNYQVGKKKAPGTIIRLAESRLRVRTSKWVPEPYSRIQVIFDDPEGGKNKLAVHCEVVRVREAAEGEEVAFDMRISPGVTSAKDIGRLRELINSMSGGSAAGASA